MSNTLRRKMFKLGGSANTHGVGITSGLKMNKGGRVGFQQGDVVRGGPFTNRAPFFNFALPGSPNFDPRFASLEEQLRPLRGEANRAFSAMKLAARDDPRTGSGILTALLGQPGEPAPEPGSPEYAQNFIEKFSPENQIDADSNYLRFTEIPGAAVDDPKTVVDETESTMGFRFVPGEEIIKERKERRGDAEPQTLEEQAAVAKEKRDAIEAITTAEKKVDTPEILGDTATDLEEDPDSFEEDVRERARVLQSLFETDSKSDVLAEALIKGGAQLLEGAGAESYKKAAEAVGDVFTRQGQTRRSIRNLATSQAIKDITAAEAADKLSESQRELYTLKLIAEAKKGATLTLKEKASLYSDLLEIGPDEAYANDYMAVIESGGELSRLPILPGAKPGEEIEKKDDNKIIAGRSYIYNGQYFSTNKRGEFKSFSTLEAAQEHAKT